MTYWDRLGAVGASWEINSGFVHYPRPLISGSLVRVSRRADASWRLGLNQCIMLGSGMAGDLTEKRLKDRTRPC